MATSRCARFWASVLDLGLTLWVLRAIVVAMLLGFAILGLAPQAQDLLIDVAAGPWWYTLLYLLSVFFVWAVPTHYAARLLVSTDRRYLLRVRRRKGCFIAGLQKWMPRLLGTLPFAAMLVGVARSWNNVPAVEPFSLTEEAKDSLLWLAFYLLAAAAIFWWYLTARKVLRRFALAQRLEAIAGALVKPLAARLPRALALGRHAPGLSRPGSDLGPLYLALMFFLFTCLPFFAPVQFAEWLPRAIAVSFVFAGWTPLAAYAAGVGRHLRVPIISLAVIVAALLTYLLGDNYSVRRVNAQQHLAEVVKAQAGQSADFALAGANDEPPITQRLKLQEAIALWKAVNCPNAGAACPRPIIIAASGGASRAGFFTASVIGKLMDGGDNIPPGELRKRLFAISSVSGSSVGAVMSVAALAASTGAQPCGDQDFWLLYWPKVTNWQSCLEALMAGDFLTPVFAGLVFRDTLRFVGGFDGSGNLWADRATLIERAWERYFRWSLKPQKAPSDRCLASLDCPFLALRPRRDGLEVEWLPLLFLNGASVSTGQRIITSTIDPLYRPATKCPWDLLGSEPDQCPVFDHAYDFHWLLGDGPPASGWLARLRRALSFGAARKELNDVRLSTAAHNSARFPLISPPGEVRNDANNVVDRIVDGGYFENFGAQTALELANAMRAVDPKLAPFILIISNDPEIPTVDVLKAPDAGEGAFLTDLSAPAATMLNTRAARGTLAVDGIVTSLAQALPEECIPYAAHVRVWPEFEDEQALRKAPSRKLPPSDDSRRVRPLSFSWWLSKPVQLRLHQQTELAGGNWESLSAVAKTFEATDPKCVGEAEEDQIEQQRKYEGVRTRQRQRP
jgi:predicted acylesterase/phospholipase RssA